MKQRFIAVAIIENDMGEILLCKKPLNKGVYAGKWGLVGGGIEPHETMEQALRREVREEVGLEISDIKQFMFKDDTQMKLQPDGSQEEVYMVFLLFDCKAISHEVVLNDEFEAYEWVEKGKIREYELGAATMNTMRLKGWL